MSGHIKDINGVCTNLCGCNMPKSTGRCLCVKTKDGWFTCEEHAPKLPVEGVKHDQAKPDLSLLPKEFLDEVAFAFMYGENKYGRYNYANGLAWHRVIAAGFRHLSAFNSGEDKDVESGLNHLSHLGACCAMLLVYYKRGIGEDTREKRKK